MIEPCRTAQELITWFYEQERRKRMCWEDLPGINLVSGPSISDQGRWETFKEAVFSMGDGSLVQASWTEGSTEYQDSDPDMDLWEVEAYTEPVTKYRRKKGAS